jgi:hypothetical protein
MKMELSSNQELYDYLHRLISTLKKAGANKLADLVSFAADQASGMSAEFLGESRVALRQVLNQENGALIQDERADLQSVVEQLNEALDQR